MTTTITKRINAVVIKTVLDESPDMSHLGEYSRTYSQADYDAGKVIDRKARGDMGRHEYQYFIAALSGKDTGNPDSVEQDYQRFESLNAGHWSMIGIYAVAQIVVGNTCQTIRSGGLYGIESDSGEDYLKQVGDEQLVELAEQLEALCFSKKTVAAAIAKATRSIE